MSAPSPGRGSGARNFRSVSPITCRWSWSRSIAWARATSGSWPIASSTGSRTASFPSPERVGEITRDNWREFLGAREREGDYRAYFAAEVARLGATPAAIHYLPQLMPGLAASATHALMRMAYATMTASDEETGVALGYWATTYLALGPSRGAKPSTGDPAEVLAFMHGPEAFRHVEPERDLLWHFMRAVAGKPEFEPVVDMLAIGPETHDRAARLSLALYAGTLDFCALHALTGMHWLRTDRAAHARPRRALALLLAGDRIAGPEDGLSRPPKRG